MCGTDSACDARGADAKMPALMVKGSGAPVNLAVHSICYETSDADSVRGDLPDCCARVLAVRAGTVSSSLTRASRRGTHPDSVTCWLYCDCVSGSDMVYGAPSWPVKGAVDAVSVMPRLQRELCF